MTRLAKRALFFTGALIFVCACAITQPTSPIQTQIQTSEDKTQIADQVATSVALTVTALPESISITDTPPPTQTTAPSLTPTLIPTIVSTATPAATPIIKPAYSCDIIEQRPRDDTVFRPNDGFDIRWTIVNTGTKRWLDETYLVYQSGPRITEVTSILLPELDPRQKYEVILEAVAPDEQERQVTVWAVVGPGTDGKNHWMCYPYVRIIVKK